jgi:hypothetical protein
MIRLPRLIGAAPLRHRVGDQWPLDDPILIGDLRSRRVRADQTGRRKRIEIDLDVTGHRNGGRRSRACLALVA